MLNHVKKTEYFKWTMIIGIILLFFEVAIFNEGLIFFLVFTLGCIYVGRKRLHKTIGKVLFWFGLISTIITLLNMMFFKFLLFAFLLYLLMRFMQKKREIDPAPTLEGKGESIPHPEGPLVKHQPIVENILLGRQATSEQVYEWKDVNIQGIIGDTVIDTSNTVLPKGEAVIVLRKLIGNVQLLIPYEVEVSIHHSVYAGAVTIFQKEEPTAFNRTIHYQTEKYEEAGQKIKIFTSIIIGDIEVKRV